MRIGIFLVFVLLVACAEQHKFEDFASSDSGRGKKEFLQDSKQCIAEKGKFSNMIQGREFGFEGEHTGYLGCMKLRGWSPKKMP
ncbi:MAG: hypothetical protein F3741_12690 [Nitrospinae bacterium]|nr:hypothetical protein [Nitrospinota bacterium]MZH41787.1 hypothetical protein [Nitrospinota bacterium]MZH46956.1 hypothetical protein [Nitrospinota bacterium]